MKRLLLFLMTLLAVPALAATLSWSPVSHYTDGSAINDDNVVYDAWDNSTIIALGTTGTAVEFVAGRGVSHNFTVRARLLRQEAVSENAVLSWSSPLGTISRPGGLAVTP